MSDTYKEIEGKLERLEPFTGNSLVGVVEQVENLFTYKVYSYGTLIGYKEYSGNEGEWYAWVTRQWYSVTTARGAKLLRRVWGVAA